MAQEQEELNHDIAAYMLTQCLPAIPYECPVQIKSQAGGADMDFGVINKTVDPKEPTGVVQCMTVIERNRVCRRCDLGKGISITLKQKRRLI